MMIIFTKKCHIKKCHIIDLDLSTPNPTFFTEIGNYTPIPRPSSRHNWFNLLAGMVKYKTSPGARIVSNKSQPCTVAWLISTYKGTKSANLSTSFTHSSQKGCIGVIVVAKATHKLSAIMPLPIILAPRAAAAKAGAANSAGLSTASKSNTCCAILNLDPA